MIKRVIKRAVIGALTGAVVVPIVGLMIAIVAVALDPRCSTPGDSGGCAIGLVTIPIALVLPGTILCGVLGAASALWAGRHGLGAQNRT